MIEKATYEEILKRDGVLVYRTRGVSMEPMLRQNRDLVVIRVPEKRLEPLDVALYKRGADYILHRVIGVKDAHYLIRGDNTYMVEHVPANAAIRVLTEFKRKEKTYSVTDKRYRCYARLWNFIYPLRAFCHRGRNFAVKTARKLGVLPLLKKVHRHE
ncbi:MAG: S24/S26 family peptidase [Anaerolineaceae bacterium]|nr:S24/S26 family peptidase [Anaerolineaceae bacterium]